MDGFQKIIISGVLSADPISVSGGKVVKASIPTTEKWKDNDGNLQKRTEWHNLVFFNRDAEIAFKYLKKGSILTLEGKNRTSKWQDKEGKDRYSHGVEVLSFQMLGSVNSNNKSNSQSSRSEDTSGRAQNANAPTGSNSNQQSAMNRSPQRHGANQPASANNNPPANPTSQQGQVNDIPDEDEIGNYMDHELEF